MDKSSNDSCLNFNQPKLNKFASNVPDVSIVSGFVTVVISQNMFSFEKSKVKITTDSFIRIAEA